jgi:predicted DNA-binding protein
LSKKKSHIIETALTLYFDMMDVKLAKKLLKDIKEGKEEVLSAEQVYKELGIE